MVNFITGFKESMSEAQLKKALQSLIRTLLDSTVAWSLRNMLVYLVYRLVDELQRRN